MNNIIESQFLWLKKEFRKQRTIKMVKIRSVLANELNQASRYVYNGFCRTFLRAVVGFLEDYMSK